MSISQMCGYCRGRGPLKTCARCHYMRYCSVDCQTKDWPEHKHKCSADKGAKLLELEKTVKIVTKDIVFLAVITGALLHHVANRPNDSYIECIVTEDNLSYTCSIKHICAAHGVLADEYNYKFTHNTPNIQYTIWNHFDPKFIKSVHEKSPIDLDFASFGESFIFVMSKRVTEGMHQTAIIYQKDDQNIMLHIT